jgi:hypothetical protein
MTCETVRLPGLGVALVCSRGRRPPKCSVRGCGGAAEFQCDAPLGLPGAGTTCDRYLCAEHRTALGPDVDFCPEHAREARYRAALAAYPDRRES